MYLNVNSMEISVYTHKRHSHSTAPSNLLMLPPEKSRMSTPDESFCRIRRIALVSLARMVHGKRGPERKRGPQVDSPRPLMAESAS